MKLRQWFTCVALAFVALASPIPSASAQADSDAAGEKAMRKDEEKTAKDEQKRADQDREAREELRSQLAPMAATLNSARYQDDFLQDYVNEMGQSLVPPEAPAGMLFSFRVVDDASPNALAFPDGRIYVNSGLLVFVDSEAQLAMVLGHEIGHVIKQHAVESLRDSRSFKKAILPGLLGSAAGAVVGGLVGGKDGTAKGAAIGGVAGLAVGVIAMNSFSRQQEDEADAVGTRAALAHGYDPSAGIAFFDRLAKEFGDEDQFSNLLWGSHPRNVERAKHVRSLLDGQLHDTYNKQRTAGQLGLGSGQMQIYTSRMYRDVAIELMETYDRYDISKRLLESIADVRARDPHTLWALGRVYKMVGRTDADRAKALDFLQRAATLDERNMYPFVNRDLGLMQARLGAAQTDLMPAAVESLKKYIRGHMEKTGTYPPDIQEVYDYLLMFGDSKWVAPKMEGVVVQQAPRSTPAKAGNSGAAKAMQQRAGH